MTKKAGKPVSERIKEYVSAAVLILLAVCAVFVVDAEFLLLSVIVAVPIALVYAVLLPLRDRFVERAKEKRAASGRPPVQAQLRLSLRPLFTAAGKGYTSVAQLAAKKTQTERVFMDCYGRTVLCLRERFPCFDSADFLYEDRYYRWFFIVSDGALTLVRSQDDRGECRVTERITRGQWENCGLDSYNRNVFTKLGFEQYLL